MASENILISKDRYDKLVAAASMASGNSNKSFSEGGSDGQADADVTSGATSGRNDDDGYDTDISEDDGPDDKKPPPVTIPGYKDVGSLIRSVKRVKSHKKNRVETSKKRGRPIKNSKEGVLLKKWIDIK